MSPPLTAPRNTTNNEKKRTTPESRGGGAPGPACVLISLYGGAARIARSEVSLSDRVSPRAARSRLVSLTNKVSTHQRALSPSPTTSDLRRADAGHTLGGGHNKTGSGGAQLKRPLVRTPIRAGVPVGKLLVSLPNAPTTGSWLGGSSGARFGRFFMMGWLMESAVSG